MNDSNLCMAGRAQSDVWDGLMSGGGGGGGGRPHVIMCGQDVWVS